MKMIIEKIPEYIEKDKREYYLSLLEKSKRDRVEKMIEKKQNETLYANYLAKKELSSVLGLKTEEIVFTYNQQGKPLLQNSDSLFFNISHSGEYIVLVTDSRPVGVDIEEVKKIDDRMIDHVLSESEKKFVKSSDDKSRNFIKLWTLKESFLKAKGIGITDTLKNYSFDISGEKIISFCGKADIIMSEEIEGYIISVCSLTNKKQKEKPELVRRSITRKFRKEIWNNFIGAVKDYELIEPGDKIGVCISGGKDSMLLALCINELIRHSQIPFEAEYIVMDPGYNEENLEKIKENAKLLGLPISVFQSPIFDYVSKQDISPCYLCAKMRRGYLYKEAQRLGCNKIALGHHFDDVIETTLLNIFYGSEVKTMMPKLRSTSYPGMELIRPLYTVREEDIIRWADYNSLEFIRCACRFTEYSEESPDSHKREEMKNLIKQLKKNNPYVDMSVFKSMHNVNLATVIGYRDGDGKDVHMFTEDY